MVLQEMSAPACGVTQIGLCLLISLKAVTKERSEVKAKPGWRPSAVNRYLL